MRLAVFDVGGTYIKYALSDEEGHLTKKGRVLTPDTKEHFQELIKQQVIQMEKVEGAAFSLPGFIDRDAGFISLGGSLRYHDNCPFVKEMESLLQVPVVIQNDAKCAAYAQIWKGHAHAYQNAVVLVFGTGVGGALIQNQEVYLGTHFMSSELSCIITGDIQREGFQATLGNTFSIPALIARIAKRINRSELTGEEVFQLLEQGNQSVKEELMKYYQSFAIQLFNLQCCYDPDVFLIGGGISEQEAFVDGIRKAAKAFIDKLPLPVPIIHVESTAHKADANLLGAVYEYLQAKGRSQV